MTKAWSITTTVRNPERLRDFLIALQPLVGQPWNTENQENFQKQLIKHRLYGYGSQQFYNGLPPELVRIINDVDIPLDDAVVAQIVDHKNYKDFDMRGRQSINPLTKLGFAYVDKGTLQLTGLGRKYIRTDNDAGDIFLKAFIKWQIPNPASSDYVDDGQYAVVPFVATLALINHVNDREVSRDGKPVGLSKWEFSTFAPTLVHYEDIPRYADEIIELRTLLKGKSKAERTQIRSDYSQIFAMNFSGNREPAQINKLLLNLRDYGDNAIRYFRLTKFIRIRGNGFYIDVEPSRHVEIAALLEDEWYKPKAFASREDYVQYLSDDSLPVLPWQTKPKLLQIVTALQTDITALRSKLGDDQIAPRDISNLTAAELSQYADDLRTERQTLQQQDSHITAQPIESITEYITQFENIYTAENRPLALEYLTTMSLHALNDSVRIQPNYPLGDDNQPTSTAPGGLADIECYYQNFNMICEVTMLKGRDQWFNEGQPVMRHLRDFENNNANCYCLFIAPSIHTDSAETFWTANVHGYKQTRQHIAPLTIKQFVTILQTLRQVRESNRTFTHGMLLELVASIADNAMAIPNSDDWVADTERLLQAWTAKVAIGTISGMV